jgi:hypothetical protein
MKGEKNFIDFIIATKENEDLLNNFLKKETPTDLKSFFESEHFQVSLEDCKKLIAAKTDLGLDEGNIPPSY